MKKSIGLIWDNMKMGRSFSGLSEIDEFYDDFATELLGDVVTSSFNEEQEGFGITLIKSILVARIPVAALISEGCDLAELVDSALDDVVFNKLAEQIEAHIEKDDGISVVWGYDIVLKQKVCRVVADEAWYIKNTFFSPKNRYNTYMKGFVVQDPSFVEQVSSESIANLVGGD